MAVIEIPPTQIGLSVNVVAGFSVVPPTTGDKLPVKSSRIITEGYTAFGSEVVSRRQCPASIRVTFDAGDVVYTPTVDLDPASTTFGCDARFLAKDALGSDVQLVWPAAQGRKPFTLTSPPGKSPELLTEDVFSFYHSRSQRWVDNEAVRFDYDAIATSDQVWTYQALNTGALPDSGFGMLGVWTLRELSEADGMAVMGFVQGGLDCGLYLNRADRLVLAIGKVFVSSVTIPAGWFNRPMMIGLYHFPRASKFVFVVASGAGQAVSKEVSWPYVTTLWSSQIGLMYSDVEQSCELLDFAVWRDNITAEEIFAAASVYSELYGV